MNSSHPREILLWLSQQNAALFSFSKYIYRPQSTLDDREYLSLKVADAYELIPSIVSELKPEQELAFHSEVIGRDARKHHIPMLDLMGEYQENSYLPALKKLMGEFQIKEFELYRTGRSAHVYGLKLLSSEEQVKFFARALLLNLPDASPIVDSRWIGHRLWAGYGSLRWSCNTKQYFQFPEKIGRYVL